MFSESVTIAATAITHRRALRDIVTRLWKRVTHGHVHIVVFGAAGAGKTSLGTLLAGTDVGDEYRESTKMETYRLDSTTTCSVFVPPGQPGLQAATWSDLARAVGSGRASVVIHVVCWGLEAIEPRRYYEVPDYRDGMTAEELVEVRAVARRRAEVATLGEFATHLKLAPRKLSLLTVVTKQDLWCTALHHRRWSKTAWSGLGAPSMLTGNDLKCSRRTIAAAACRSGAASGERRG